MDLEDSKTFADYSITNDTTVFLVMRVSDDTDSQSNKPAIQQRYESMDKNAPSAVSDTIQPIEPEPDTIQQIEPEQAVDAAAQRRSLWTGRLELARDVLQWASVRARPLAVGVADAAKTGGERASRAATVGGLVAGGGLAAIGLAAVGGPLGIGVAVAGGTVGAAGLAGAWVVDKVSKAAATGINIAGAP
jgi:hypothetical protein